MKCIKVDNCVELTSATQFCEPALLASTECLARKMRSCSETSCDYRHYLPK